ncbi:MAG: transcription elongation factor GreA [Parcubacteria group bacterium Gr01-1014_66]|nr:MAG: transcription elongation factor GreA [Parcubacteria group bacterium Gr01-1014_66]
MKRQNQINETIDQSSHDVEYMSREGYEKLKGELESLKTQERLRIAERLEYAKSLGDLSENAEFDAAKEEQMLNEMRISELEQLLRHSTIVDKKGSSVTVGIGSTIVVRRETAPHEETYTLVGSSEEANPLTGCISHESPLGRAFFGCKKGQSVLVTTPRGDVGYVIVEVS